MRLSGAGRASRGRGRQEEKDGGSGGEKQRGHDAFIDAVKRGRQISPSVGARPLRAGGQRAGRRLPTCGNSQLFSSGKRRRRFGKCCRVEGSSWHAFVRLEHPPSPSKSIYLKLRAT